MLVDDKISLRTRQTSTYICTDSPQTPTDSPHTPDRSRQSSDGARTAVDWSKNYNFPNPGICTVWLGLHSLNIEYPWLATCSIYISIFIAPFRSIPEKEHEGKYVHVVVYKFLQQPPITPVSIIHPLSHFVDTLYIYINTNYWGTCIKIKRTTRLSLFRGRVIH